jgi:hypothetical protein
VENAGSTSTFKGTPLFVKSRRPRRKKVDRDEYGSAATDEVHMDFNLNVKAFLKALRLAEMSGHQKFLAVAALNCKGKPGVEVATRIVQDQWLKSLMGQEYNPIFYERAQREGWVDSVPGRKGMFNVNQPGLDQLAALEKSDGIQAPGDLQKAGGLVVVNRRATHSFDKYLRKIFVVAKTEVLIADSYVDGTIFDTVLDVIPQTITIKLLYGRATGTFAAKAARFSTQWTRFSSKRYKSLHDRFMVIDGLGYVLGPSIKDAASNSPALVVELAPNEKRLLKNFFQELWANAKGLAKL